MSWKVENHTDSASWDRNDNVTCVHTSTASVIRASDHSPTGCTRVDPHGYPQGGDIGRHRHERPNVAGWFPRANLHEKGGCAGSMGAADWCGQLTRLWFARRGWESARVRP